MYTGKYNNNKWFHKRNLILAASLLLLITVVVSGTVAWITSNTDNVVNEFTLTSVPNEVVEKFDGNTKTEVKIKNTSVDVPAYIRASVVINWVNPDNPSEVAGEVPVERTDYDITWTMKDWVKGSDGYYYYTKSVDPGDTTDELFTDCAPVANKTPAGYALSVEILGESVQAVPAQAVKEAWGVTVNADGTIIK